jgi:hypothetical protein
MISPRALESIDRLVCRSLQETCRDAAGEPCAVSLAARTLQQADATVTDVQLLNISSYHFRLVFLFYFNREPALGEQLASILHSPGQLADQALMDAHGELANRVCGAVNRTLASCFTHVGMSTPLPLELECLRHFDILQPEQVWTYAVDFSNQARMHLSVCLFPHAGEDLDFHLDLRVTEQEPSGELELF